MPRMRTVGWPALTSADWPLPQIPGPKSRSSPTASIPLMTSRQLPISVAPLTGVVFFPFSMR